MSDNDPWALDRENIRQMLSYQQSIELEQRQHKQRHTRRGQPAQPGIATSQTAPWSMVRYGHFFLCIASAYLLFKGCLATAAMGVERVIMVTHGVETPLALALVNSITYTLLCFAALGGLALIGAALQAPSLKRTLHTLRMCALVSVIFGIGITIYLFSRN